MVRTMVAEDAFTHILTNSILAAQVHCEASKRPGRPTAHRRPQEPCRHAARNEAPNTVLRPSFLVPKSLETGRRETRIDRRRCAAPSQIRCLLKRKAPARAATSERSVGIDAAEVEKYQSLGPTSCTLGSTNRDVRPLPGLSSHLDHVADGATATRRGPHPDVSREEACPKPG